MDNLPATSCNAIAKLSNTLGFPESEIIDTIKRMIISAKGQQQATCTNAELTILSSICAKYDLDPFLKEVQVFVAGGKLMFSIGLDGWFKIMSRHPLFDGYECEDIFSADGSLLAVKAKLYLKGITHPICATEYLSECMVKGKNGLQSSWEKYPHRRLEGKAIAQAVRRGMGVSNIVDDDEKQRIIDAQPNIMQVSQGVQSAPTMNFDAVKKELMAARNLAELKEAANSVREKLRAIGTWDVLKDDFLEFYKPLFEKHEKAPFNNHGSEMQIIDAEIIDEATGEIIMQDAQAAQIDRENNLDQEIELD